ncbi:glycosyl hydrolase family 92-domain-containing protein [Trichophaea hybrida]|nr:glycosyl hydrolase family 92-domain-containing protein [Trichophaea hybrida]
MGSEGGGNMFPGVTYPFGVVKLGIDIQPPPGAGDAYSGYHPLGSITGFSMLHESGTGGAPKYGVVSQLPLVGNISNPLLLNLSVPRSAPDEAGVGWYKTRMSHGVMVELAASRHAGIIRYSFPRSSREKNVLVDVSHFLPSTRRIGIGQQYVEGGIEVHDDGHYTGYGVYNGGWNYAADWKIFFCGKFSSPVKVATFEGVDETLESFGTKQKVSGKKRVGALFTFTSPSATSDNQFLRLRKRSLRRRSSWSLMPRQQQEKDSNSTEIIVESRVGVSWISEDKACQFIKDEISNDNDAYETAVQGVRDAWSKDVLSKITTTDTDVQKLRLLYTSLYGMFLLPSDRTDENPGWKSTEPYYDDIFTLWDLFRSHTPLFHILQPKRYSDFIRSLVDTWRFDGWLPDGRSSNYNGRIQGGTNADNILADARVKGVTGVNWEDAYSAMVHDAEDVPPNPNPDPQAPDSSTKQGRGALPDWKEHGYITSRFSRAVSRASEYSLNDFCLSQVAKSMGKLDDHEKYLNRSKGWRNHWDLRMSIYNFTGFLSPLTPDGKFPEIPQNPLDCDSCYWHAPYYQATPFEYSFNAHHDMKTLISLMGGDNRFLSRLNKLFEPHSDPLGSPRFGNTIFDPGNEPSFASPYLFNFVPGNQWRSVATSRYISRTYYNTENRGLPGNSDAGAMQSWNLWSMLGLYPITGTTTFLIGAPQVKDLTIKLGDMKTLEITASGGNEGRGKWFVQKLKVNGKDWNKSWVLWEDVFKDGGRMEFVLGQKKVQWDRDGERPLWGIV